MSVDPAIAGRVYPPSAPYQVGREKIREFAAATRATHPAHHDVEAAKALGYTDLVAPPTFAVLLAQRVEAQLVEDPAAGIDFSRVVHGEEKFRHHRPIVAGDELTGVLTSSRSGSGPASPCSPPGSNWPTAPVRRSARSSRCW